MMRVYRASESEEWLYTERGGLSIVPVLIPLCSSIS